MRSGKDLLPASSHVGGMLIGFPIEWDSPVRQSSCPETTLTGLKLKGN